eukprot:gnl/Hemi2/12512_TR4266_c0_g1_i1.p1 gnl/Hemi2/12512_TR4266_c0_g1~~gnl/Hemi2/12512_TR4266_c0_g1_i1.p1  ORF type:complete len:485 (-),score=106.28 gnl/Hemi2/12512_TR4266_c0_g1_i1:129-1583(-)
MDTTATTQTTTTTTITEPPQRPAYVMLTKDSHRGNNSALPAVLRRSSSAVSGFYNMTRAQRISILTEQLGLSEDDQNLLTKDTGALTFETANGMSENVVSCFPLPLGICMNMLVNGQDLFVPMVAEEASVVAACSLAAKLARPAGGFTGTGTEPLMIGQVQMVSPPGQAWDSERWEQARASILANKQKIIDFANERCPSKYGGGAKDLELRLLDTSRGLMLIAHLIVDVREAMGANIVNSMCEAVAGHFELFTGATVRLRILSNLCVHRLFTAEATWHKEELAKSVKPSVDGQVMSGEDIVEAILDASAWAEADPFRAATHNKGIMNGVDAVLIATGNDFRAAESSAHSFAAFNGKYTSLTRYSKTSDGHLKGSITLPLALGTVGGIHANPLASLCLRILKVTGAKDLGIVAAATGLAQNFAALRALATEGIQKGHMRLHAKNIALQAGATGGMVETIAHLMADKGEISSGHARFLLTQLCRMM